VQIAIPRFDRLTALDAIGPYEVLSRLPGAEVLFVAAEPGLKRTDTGALALTAERGLSEVPQPDIVVVPGGRGTRDQPHDQLVAWIQRAHQTSRWTTSVCTGALLLGAEEVLTVPLRGGCRTKADSETPLHVRGSAREQPCAATSRRTARPRSPRSPTRRARDTRQTLSGPNRPEHGARGSRVPSVPAVPGPGSVGGSADQWPASRFGDQAARLDDRPSPRAARCALGPDLWPLRLIQIALLTPRAALTDPRPTEGRGTAQRPIPLVRLYQLRRRGVGRNLPGSPYMPSPGSSGVRVRGTAWLFRAKCCFARHAAPSRPREPSARTGSRTPRHSCIRTWSSGVVTLWALGRGTRRDAAEVSEELAA
jgi:hypothetical protein